MTEATPNPDEGQIPPVDETPISQDKDPDMLEMYVPVEYAVPPFQRLRIRRAQALWALGMLVIYLLGLGSGYGLWGLPTPEERAAQKQQTEMAEMMAQINPVNGYTVPAGKYGDMGPKMAAAGVFDVAEFEQVYQQAKQPLTAQQLSIIKEGSNNPIVFNSQTSYFLLNYFWAVGLSNQNPILDSGLIQEASKGKVENFASTGGWSLANKPLNEIFSKLRLITLTADQQKNLEQAAKAVYRPCCDNPTDFPDCNHGMAMLGLLELMASQNASVTQMLDAAKHANAYWYPSQTIEQAIFFKNTSGMAYKDIDASLLLGPKYASGSGFQGLHQYLAQNSLLPEAPKSAGGCGV